MVGELADRQEEALDVLQEGHEHPKRQGTRDDLAAAHPDDQGGRDGGEQSHKWKEQREEEQRAQRCRPVVLVQDIERPKVPLLTIEELDDLRARDVLGDVGVDARQPHPDRAEVVAHGTLKVAGHPGQWGQHEKDHQRELPVLDQQDEQDSDDREHIAEQSDGSGGKEVVQGVHVVGDARHQPANGVVIEEGERQRLEVAEHARAQVEHHSLTDHAQQEVLKIA